LEYLLLLKKGDAELAKLGKPEFIYNKEDLTAVKDSFSEMMKNREHTAGVSTYVTNFDTEMQHLIPEYKRILSGEIYAPIEKRLLMGLGLIDIAEGLSSSRRESILNPKPFIAEIYTAIDDFKQLLNDLFQTIVIENTTAKKYFSGRTIKISNTAPKQFIPTDLKEHLRSLYDRGVLSKETYADLMGEGMIDFQTEVDRRKEETKEIDELMQPHPVQFIPDDTTVPDSPSIDDVTPNKLGPEAKNYRAGLESSVVVKRKDGWYVLSEKTDKSLGGPYKTKKEALERLKEVEHFKNE
jgi:hypothetical protein